MNKYELALVVSAKIDDDARTAVVDKAKAIIEKAGGTITNVDEKGKLRLAYEIQKIEASVRIMESVLRYLCVRQDAE